MSIQRRRPRASLCGVSHDRERAVTPGRGARPREKGPPDGYLNAAVCMRVRYVAVHRRLESKPAQRRRRCMEPRWYGNAVSGRVTALLGDDSNRGV